MAKIRNIKDPKVKRELRTMASIRRAEKKAKAAVRRAELAKIKAEKALVIAQKALTAVQQAKRRILKRGDKQKIFYNKGQKRHRINVLRFLQSASKQKIIDSLCSIPVHDVEEVMGIRNEGSFVSYIKHISKRKDVKYRVIVAVHGDTIILVRTYRKMVELRTKYGTTVLFYPITNMFNMLVLHKQKTEYYKKVKRA